MTEAHQSEQLKKGINYKGDERKLLDVLDSDAISVDYISFKHASVITLISPSFFFLLLNGCWWSGKNWNSRLIRGFKLHTAFQAPCPELRIQTWMRHDYSAQEAFTSEDCVVVV